MNEARFAGICERVARNVPLKSEVTSTGATLSLWIPLDMDKPASAFVKLMSSTIKDIERTASTITKSAKGKASPAKAKINRFGLDITCEIVWAKKLGPNQQGTVLNVLDKHTEVSSKW